jgi:hypothetical protein
MCLEGGVLLQQRFHSRPANSRKEWRVEFHAFLVAGPVSLKKNVRINATAIP